MTVYCDPDVHRALRMKAAALDRTLSEMMNEAVKLSLAEDAGDLAAFTERANEAAVDFEPFVKDLRRRGRV